MPVSEPLHFPPSRRPDNQNLDVTTEGPAPSGRVGKAASQRRDFLDSRSGHAANGAVAHSALNGDSAAVPLSRSPPPFLPSDFATQDLDDLLSAVKARLSRTVGEPLATLPEFQANGDARQIQANVLECVAALDQLHMTLRHEFSRRQQLEMDAFDARTALAQARAELLGTQVGERRARYLSLHDGLTSLPNREHLRERLDQILAQADPGGAAIAVLYLDLDDFKAINDAHGHDIGDELLRIVAARLTRTIRAEDVVGRMGGDEFVCVVTGMRGREQLSSLARKLFRAVSAPLKVGDLNLRVQPSIGIALGPDDGATVDSLLKSADAAMYHAKQHHTGHAFFAQRATA